MAKKIIFLIVVYLFIFNPGFSFLPFSGIKLVYPIMVYILIKRKSNSWFFVDVNAIFLLLLIYVVAHELLFQNFVFTKQTIVDYIEVIILPYSLALIAFDFFRSSQVYSYIFAAILLATVITLTMIFIPDFNYWIKYSLLKQNIFFDTIRNRTYGVSEYLTFMYPIILAVFSSLLLSNYFRLYWIFLSPFLLFASVLNARIGAASFFLSLFLLIYKKKISFKTINITLLYWGGLIFLIVCFLYAQYSNLINWSLSFFDEIFSLDNSSSSSLNTLLDDMLIFPNSMEGFILGNNINIYTLPSGNSDIGYLIQLNYGGIIYVLLLLLLPIYLYVRIASREKVYFVFLKIALLILIVSNFKGFAFNSNPLYRIILFVCFYEMCKGEINDEKSFTRYIF